jgi:transposase-like protein
MWAGVIFPPVAVFWDSEDHWLSDGFQRIDAARLADLAEIRAAIRPGTREDAQWDSFAANATHGLRRTPAETKSVIQLALQHPNSTEMSNVQIARHLHIPESTVRYWRKRLSSQRCEDGVRTVTRGTATYSLATTNLGKRIAERSGKPRRDLQIDLAVMKEKASAAVRPLLVIQPR